jgi:hypothetical protein
LIEAQKGDVHIDEINKIASQLYLAATSHEERTALMRALDFVHAGDFYKALSHIRALMRREAPDCLPSGVADDHAPDESPEGEGTAPRQGQKPRSIFTYSVEEEDHGVSSPDRIWNRSTAHHP